MAEITTQNPATGDDLSSYPVTTPEEVTSRIELADARHLVWRRSPLDERSALLERLAGVLEERREPLAALMADEMGKPLAQGRAEVDKCAWVCRYYAEHGPEMLADQEIETDFSRSYIHHEPLGVVLAVMPWNFPLWQVFRFLVPALMAGNSGLLKHASNVTGCALEIHEMVEAAGAPDGLFSTLVLPSNRVEAVIEHPLVRAVTLTGSEPAGRAVAAVAGRELKKCVLELGGSDPYLVLADADLDLAAEVCARSRLNNSGQTCIAAKRFVVEEAIHDDFVDRLVAELSSRVVGDPHDESSDVGPMARPDLRDELREQVDASVAAGATLAMEGEAPDHGAFHPVMLLTDVTTDMVAGAEELFGPVGAVLRAVDTDDAVRIANSTRFGLGAAVFTTDADKGATIAAERLAAGSCFVNELVASDPRLPFGGIKASGFGRELSHLGMYEFMNAKTVAVR